MCQGRAYFRKGGLWHQIPYRFCGGGEGGACWQCDCWRSRCAPLNPRIEDADPDRSPPPKDGDPITGICFFCWLRNWNLKETSRLRLLIHWWMGRTLFWGRSRGSAIDCNRLLLASTIIYYYFILRMHCLGGIIKVGCPLIHIFHHKNTSISRITDHDKAQRKTPLPVRCKSPCWTTPLWRRWTRNQLAGQSFWPQSRTLFHFHLFISSRMFVRGVHHQNW